MLRLVLNSNLMVHGMDMGVREVELDTTTEQVLSTLGKEEVRRGYEKLWVPKSPASTPSPKVDGEPKQPESKSPEGAPQPTSTPVHTDPKNSQVPPEESSSNP